MKFSNFDWMTKLRGARFRHVEVWKKAKLYWVTNFIFFAWLITCGNENLVWGFEKVKFLKFVSKATDSKQNFAFFKNSIGRNLTPRSLVIQSKFENFTFIQCSLKKILLVTHHIKCHLLKLWAWWSRKNVPLSA